jgi:starch synthase
MNVALSTIGRFHTFDLARQLHRRNALTAVFSGYPSIKLKNEGIPRQSVKTFPWLHAPYMRFAPRYEPLRILWEWHDRLWFDRYVSRNLPLCDIFCGLSGSALETGKAAKRRGAKYVCDRGSSHIRFQGQILAEEYDRQGIYFSGIDPRIVAREEAEYDLADAITLPSTFSVGTFLKLGVHAHKLRLAPYGVDLSMFHPTSAPTHNEFRVLFVGAISVRKGVQYLLDAFDQLEHKHKHLTLVGSIAAELKPLVDRLRSRDDVSIMGHVARSHLKDIMSTSHVMVLPSIEDGFGLVQAQAMACGCPVVASANTGASDLFTDGIEGFIIPIRDTEGIAQRLQTLADNPDLRDQMGAVAIQRVKSINGWNQYGEIIYKTFAELLN